MKIFFLSICLFFFTHCHCQCKKIEYVVDSSVQSVKPLDTLFLYSACSSPSRIFLEKLTTNLEKILSEKGMIYSYQHLSTHVDANHFREVSARHRFTLFVIGNETDFNVVGKTRRYSGAGIELTARKTLIALKENFQLMLFDSDSNLAFSAKMNVDCKDMQKEKGLQKIAKLIVNSLYVSGYLK